MQRAVFNLIHSLDHNRIVGNKNGWEISQPFLFPTILLVQGSAEPYCLIISLFPKFPPVLLFRFFRNTLLHFFFLKRFVAIFLLLL